MSSLKDKIGQWVNIEVSVDNTARRAEVFVDGELETSVESESFSKRITKTANSKFTIGSSRNKQKGFRGRFQNFEVKKGKATREMVKLRYQNKTKKSRTLFNMDFKNVVGSGSSRKFLDKGKKRMQVKSSGEFSTAPTVSQVSGSDAVALSIDESSGQGGLVVEETGGTFQNLEKSTFSAMVKLPAGHARDGFEPIMSKSDKFAFGVHEGKAALYMANQGNLVPYLGEKEEESGVVKADDDLLLEASFDGSSKYVSVEGTPEYVLGINKSKAVKNEIKVHKNAIYGKDLDSFAVSMWVKPDELGESTLFERPDSELSMLTDAAGVLTLKSNPVELRIEDHALVRYVRFSLNAPSSAPDKPASAFALNLYEFRVYDDTGALVSYNKPTSGSSYYNNLDMYLPELATDDPQDDPFINKTGFHSKHTNGTDWLEIDLGEKKKISRVLLVNYYDVSTQSSQGVYVIDRIAQGGGYLTFKDENQEEVKVSQELYWDGPLTGRYAYEYDVKSSTWDGRNDTRASGGDEVFNVGENRVHKFTSSGTFKTNKPVEITYLVVGGGGAGGSDRGGGGGGGGVKQGSVVLPAGSYPITVGAGGVPKDQYQSGGKGGSSSLGDIVSVSGGGGGGGEGSAPSSGGSGGGSSYGYGNLSGASGIPGEGNAGSDGWDAMGQRTTGGGGGALMPGRGGKPDGYPERPDGGRGFKSIITGTIVGYGGGGGGGATDGDHGGHSGSRGLATDGGGHGGLADSAGGYGFEGVNGLGGGGGGGAGGGSSAHGTDTTNGRKGGSGVVIISYKHIALPESYGFGGDVFEVNGYRVHAFIGSTNAFINPVSRPVDVLLVGGGGGGGSDNAGGGGAGGLVFKPNHTISAGTHQVTVGRGGRGAANVEGTDSAENGFDTSFAGLIAKGGGRGGSGSTPFDNHLPGGSGGGAQGERNDFQLDGKPGIQSLQDGDSGEYGYGNAGGAGSAADAGGGGGGGAGGPGQDGGDPLGGAGGIGKYQVFDESTQTTYDFAQMFGMKYGEQDGNKIYFAGGGAGGNKNYTDATVLGGMGGGGDQYGSSSNPRDGGHNTGGGGAGSALMHNYTARPDSGGATGGTGIVLLRYPIAESIAPRENVYEFIVNKHNESSIGIHINYMNMDGHDIHPDDVTWVYPPDRHNTGADVLKHNDLAGAWNKSYNEGQTIFTVTTRRDVKLFNIYYSRIRYRPGWLIKKNGVTVVKEDDNPGDALEPGWAQYAMDKPYYEDAQDTYSRYPPFDMTTDSQSGYVVSSSTDAYHTTNFEQWAAFSFSNTSGWHSGNPYPGQSTRWTHTFKGDSAGATYDVNAHGNFGHAKTSFAGIDGEWIKMQMPHKIVLSKFFLRHRNGQGDNYGQAPRDFRVYGSEDDSNWDLICDYVGQDSPSEGRYFDAPAKKAYKYFTFLVTRVQRNDGSGSMVTIQNLIYYGRLEGDPVREIPLVYWNNANRPFDPMIGTRGYNLDANREELFTSNGWIDPANQTNLMDGSSTTLYATSATQLKADHPSLGDGLYYYKIPGTSTVKGLYTDMTRNGGGWVCISKWGGHGKTDEKLYNINERQLNVLQTNTFGSVHDYARLSMDHMNRIWPESQYVLRIHFWSQYDITWSHYRTSGVYFQNKLTNHASFDLWKAHYSPLYWSDFNKNHYQAIGGGTYYSVVYDDHNTSADLSSYTGINSAFNPNAARGTQDQIGRFSGRQGGRNAGMGWWDNWTYNGSYGPGGSWQVARHMGFFGDITHGNQWLLTNNWSDSRWNVSEDRKTMVFIRW